MLKIGITGGIGVGKSYVSNIIEKMGYPVFYADQTAKDLVKSDYKLIESIKKEFGHEIFLNKKIDVLVSTTVIEVGIDFPNATVIVIENANKYGLSQLHQLRGRVGRGSTESSCILIFKSNLSENAKKRINILKQSNDGFEISEQDMILRGYGDVLGFKQSGIKKFKLADPILHKDLFDLAEKEVRKIELNNEKLGEYYKLLKLYDRASIINDII